MKEFKMNINGNEYNVTINDVEDNVAKVEVNGMPYKVTMDKPMRKTQATPRPTVTKPNNAPTQTVSTPAAPVSKPAGGGAGGAVKSPLPGVILEVNVKEGDAVKIGQKLCMLEAMKMENVINSDKEGKVIEVKIKQGDSVLEGADLIIIG